ncbi:hypothetical protein SHI21_19425 [Bacteriovorax sp. PP10]|uniref:Lipoprotein n=1 Tax=Bacteriovorax antarcticus TaxID=3088717 RepID=A0ABU5VZF0_9BACT|nr:hypothetical protein [Bacteriovorax sp. PP10]MEA9358416.1 hypothetical protein [Bacteriovorax sp. PP10]
MRFVICILLLLTSSCATNSSNEKILFVEKPKADCVKVASLSTIGFSLIPPVATAIAKTMLEKKAEEYKANTIQINKETGMFQVEIEATGYRCSAS